MSMNSEAQQHLERILAAGPTSVSDADKAFLYARRSYLNDEQKKDFHITESAPKPAEEAPAKRSRKASEQ